MKKSEKELYFHLLQKELFLYDESFYFIHFKRWLSQLDHRKSADWNEKETRFLFLLKARF
jgi:hypothetical protein